MKIRKFQGFLAFLLVLALLMTQAVAAEETTPSQRSAAWYAPMLHTRGSVMYLLQDEALDRIAQLPSEDVHAIVEALFLAAAGTSEQEETTLWKTLSTEAEKEARSRETAAYRADTLPWLLAAFAPGNPAGTQASAPEAVTEAEASPSPESESAWQAAAGMAAFGSNPHGQAFLELLTPLGGTDADSCLAVTQAVIQRWLAELDHDQLSSINSHYQCWIYVPATPIDYPIVQCGNNSYYLDRLFNRTANPAGTLFIDYRNLSGFRDPNTLIYGHHMRDSSMFHSLTDYDAEGFYQAHPFMVIISRDAIFVAEVFAGYVTDSGDHCYDIAISGEEDMRQFTQRAAEKSDFDAHVEINCRKDRLVTLSTCAYNFDNARYILIARLVPAWERAAE